MTPPPLFFKKVTWKTVFITVFCIFFVSFLITSLLHTNGRSRSKIYCKSDPDLTQWIPIIWQDPDLTQWIHIIWQDPQHVNFLTIHSLLNTVKSYECKDNFTSLFILLLLLLQWVKMPSTRKWSPPPLTVEEHLSALFRKRNILVYLTVYQLELGPNGFVKMW